MTLRYSTSNMVLKLKGQRSRLGLELGLTAMRHGFELYECLLVNLVTVAYTKVTTNECLR